MMNTLPPRRMSVLCAMGLWCVVQGSSVFADLPSAAPPLPAPTGKIVRVGTAQQLQQLMPRLTSDTTVMLEKGVYKLIVSVRIRAGLKNITLRGATGNPDDVQLVGLGMKAPNEGNVPHGIMVEAADNVTIADLTVKDVFNHPIIFNQSGKNVRVYHCRLVDAGEQFIKSNRLQGVGVANGIVEYCTMEYTNQGKSDYTNGVDVHGGTNWIIRHNLFKNIRSPNGKLAGPAILMWNNTLNTLVEGNTFIDCTRGITLGLQQRSVTTPGKFDHVGGIIRNNVFYRSATMPGDVGIYVGDCPDAQIYHNTVLMNGTYESAIEYRFKATTNCQIKHNLTDAPITPRAGASGEVAANLTSAKLPWFVSPAAGDFRLQATATEAIDQLPPLKDVTVDFFGKKRPLHDKTEYGAVEFDTTK